MKKDIYIVSILYVLILSVLVSGFVSQYLEDDTFKILYGHDDKFRILLQNPDDGLKVFQIDVNSDIADIQGEKQRIYELKTKTDEELFINIELPETAEVGDIFSVNYKVKEIVQKTGEKSGALISIGPAFSKNFEVLVTSQNPPRFDTDFIKLTAYVKRLFKYDVNCKDEDGDKLRYTVNKLNIDENGILSFTPKFFGRKKVKVTCSDGVDIVEKTIVIGIRDPLFFIRWWFLSIIVIFIVLYIVHKKRQQKLLEEEIKKEERKVKKREEKKT